MYFTFFLTSLSPPPLPPMPIMPLPMPLDRRAVVGKESEDGEEDEEENEDIRLERGTTPGREVVDVTCSV